MQITSAVSRQFGTSTRLPQVCYKSGCYLIVLFVVMYRLQTVVLEMMVVGLKVSSGFSFTRSVQYIVTPHFLDFQPSSLLLIQLESPHGLLPPPPT